MDTHPSKHNEKRGEAKLLGCKYAFEMNQEILPRILRRFVSDYTGHCELRSFEYKVRPVVGMSHVHNAVYALIKLALTHKPLGAFMNLEEKDSNSA